MGPVGERETEREQGTEREGEREGEIEREREREKRVGLTQGLILPCVDTTRHKAL